MDESVAYLGNSAVVNLDQVARVGIDLKAPVKGKSRVDCFGGCRYCLSVMRLGHSPKDAYDRSS